MDFGEKLIHTGGGVVIGDDTDRVVAKFSHEQEADSFCEMVNQEGRTDKDFEPDYGFVELIVNRSES